MDNYFERVLELQEKLIRNEITFEEFEKQMSLLEPKSVQLDTSSDELLSNNMLELNETIKNQNRFFSDYLRSVDSETKEQKSTSSKLRDLSSYIKRTIEPIMNEVPLEVGKQKLNSLSSFGEKILSIERDKVKSIMDSVIVGKKECDHKFVYLVSEASPIKYESKLFNNMSSTKVIICKCLDCGKEFISSRDKMIGSLVETDKDYFMVKSAYKKNKGSIVTLDDIYNVIDDNKKLKL